MRIDDDSCYSDFGSVKFSHDGTAYLALQKVGKAIQQILYESEAGQASH